MISIMKLLEIILLVMGLCFNVLNTICARIMQDAAFEMQLLLTGAFQGKKQEKSAVSLF